MLSTERNQKPKQQWVFATGKARDGKKEKNGHRRKRRERQTNKGNDLYIIVGKRVWKAEEQEIVERKKKKLTKRGF